LRIATDDRAGYHTGIGTYARKIGEMLPQMFPEHVFLDLQGSRIEPIASKLQRRISQVKRLYWEQWTLPKMLSKQRVDILHNTMNIGVPIQDVSSKIIVTVHDVIPLVYEQVYLKSSIERFYYQHSLEHVIKKAAKIITVSNYSKSELVKRLGVDENKIDVTMLGCSPEFKPVNKDIAERVRTKFGINGSFILTIGGNEPRKNVKRLIKAFDQIVLKHQFKLVVVGAGWRGTDPKILSQPDVIFTGMVSNDDLIALYSSASLFIFPSLYEGFGLPVLEAMACETPVLTSNVTSMPEVAGDAALYFDPQDETDIYAKIDKALSDENLQKSLIQKGRDRCKLFQWEDTVRKTMAVYESVI
jgi:glycosyltransferase involved in cell wall biosynthesis